ncbi:hypothetical protein LCGC14_2305930 [marine sediment metagenome]|uniref:Uncharacterized protein n=1 Tax=marine sediment metagenome TaxID=412755 RepID=A0A0F9CM43_9ZZZZ
MSEVKKTEDFVLMLMNMRVAFPNFWVATKMKPTDKAAFSGSFIMPLEHPQIPEIRAAITAVAVAKWGDQANEILKVLIAGDKVCLHNGDLKAQYDGFAGNLYVSARGYSRPLILGQDKARLDEADGKPYSGCYVNARVALWAQSNSWGKRINAQLGGVQFLRDGEAFGGGSVAQPDEFETVAGGDADGEAPVIDTGVWDDLVGPQ